MNEFLRLLELHSTMWNISDDELIVLRAALPIIYEQEKKYGNRIKELECVESE